MPDIVIVDTSVLLPAERFHEHHDQGTAHRPIREPVPARRGAH